MSYAVFLLEEVSPLLNSVFENQSAVWILIIENLVPIINLLCDSADITYKLQRKCHTKG